MQSFYLVAKLPTNKYNESQHSKGGVRPGVDVGMSRLVDLHHAQHRRHVHERRVWKTVNIFITALAFANGFSYTCLKYGFN